MTDLSLESSGQNFRTTPGKTTRCRHSPPLHPKSPQFSPSPPPRDLADAARPPGLCSPGSGGPGASRRRPRSTPTHLRGRLATPARPCVWDPRTSPAPRPHTRAPGNAPRPISLCRRRNGCGASRAVAAVLISALFVDMFLRIPSRLWPFLSTIGLCVKPLGFAISV